VAGWLPIRFGARLLGEPGAMVPGSWAGARTFGLPLPFPIREEASVFGVPEPLPPTRAGS
jgi:hypothetical protein